VHPRHDRYLKKVKPIIGAYYKYVQTVNKGEHQPLWRGIKVTKGPTDLILYAEAIFENKPDYIIETGTRFGGSAAFFADILAISGGKKVFTIDTVLQRRRNNDHPMVQYIIGSSIDLKTIEFLMDQIDNIGSIMISLDSDHSIKHVLRELDLYSSLVTAGQYMVVEDAWNYRPEPSGPYHAMQQFLATNSNFERRNPEEKYIFGNTRDGWLKKLR
jgi:cephalosporin hydroxylase